MTKKKMLIILASCVSFLFLGTVSAEGEKCDKTVAVVGAGMSGLVAADELEKRGCKVEVFERESRIGGKVFTYTDPTTGLTVELGAVLVTDKYVNTLRYANALGIEYNKSLNEIKILDESGKKLTPQEFLLSRYSIQELAVATQNYAGVLDRFDDFINSPGFTNMAPALAQRFDKFAKRFGIEPIAELVRALNVGFGYAYPENVSAAYYVKFLPFLVDIVERKLETATPMVFPKGYSSLLEAIAETLDIPVQVNAEVTQIERKRPWQDWGHQKDVVITINNTEQREFDAVVISPSLDVVPKFLDTTLREQWLFKKIENNRYVVTTFLAAGIATGESLYFYPNAFSHRINHVGVWSGRPVPNVSGGFVGNAYQTAAWDQSSQELLDTLAGDVAAQGGVFLGSLIQKDWSYFPHVKPIEVLLKYYDRVDSMQCNLNTAYTGSSLTFETVEHVARHAKYVVEKCFGN